MFEMKIRASQDDDYDDIDRGDARMARRGGGMSMQRSQSQGYGHDAYRDRYIATNDPGVQLGAGARAANAVDRVAGKFNVAPVLVAAAGGFMAHELLEGLMKLAIWGVLGVGGYYFATQQRAKGR